TTFPKPESVYLELDIANRNAFNTGRGSYKCAREADAIKDDVRRKLLDINDIKNGKVIFTNSATRSLNDIIFGMDIKENDYIYISPFEHNSIIRPLEELKKRKNINIKVLPFDATTWIPNYEKINDMFALQKPAAIFVSQVSNVTGYILPYDKIFELSNKYNSINTLDASQGFGIVPIKECQNINCRSQIIICVIWSCWIY
ncbi:MAG: aminotransferase class V-fold PLP-dependent enzyme, partial [Bacilli bacterium]